MSTPKKPIAIYHEHQDWFRPLFSEFERRGTLYIRIDARQHRLDIAKPDGEFSLLFNRMSPSAYTRGNGPASSTPSNTWRTWNERDRA